MTSGGGPGMEIGGWDNEVEPALEVGFENRPEIEPFPFVLGLMPGFSESVELSHSINTIMLSLLVISMHEYG